jgi:hypothetical protein
MAISHFILKNIKAEIGVGEYVLINSKCTLFQLYHDENKLHFNTVVSNHFHSVKILLFSSARLRNFDGMPGTELPVSVHNKNSNRYVPF